MLAHTEVKPFGKYSHTGEDPHIYDITIVSFI